LSDFKLIGGFPRPNFYIWFAEVLCSCIIGFLACNWQQNPNLVLKSSFLGFNEVNTARTQKAISAYYTFFKVGMILNR